jgi:hypothetical protein
MSGLRELSGFRHGEAFAARSAIPLLAYELADPVAGGPAGGPAGGLEAFKAGVLARTMSLTLLAGSGSRWQSTLAAARTEGRLSGAAASFDAGLPRGLFPVRDFLTGGEDIPIAAYSIAALAGTGGHLIVVRGHEEAIRRDIIDRLGLDRDKWVFFTQEAPLGRPLGHGDAAWQCRRLWRDWDWIVVNFGGDPSSRPTVEASLLALAALSTAAVRDGLSPVDCLLPVARVADPTYPIELDDSGRPLGFGHNKLRGKRETLDAEYGYANIGLRMYRSSALAAMLEDFRATYWVEGRGYAIPGNDPEGAECALDNIDLEFARQGRARILPIAMSEELSPVKSFPDVGRFEVSMARILGL